MPILQLAPSQGPVSACGASPAVHHLRIVGKSDFDYGILILESIFPNFSEYFS